MVAPNCLANGTAYCSAFFEQSEKSIGTRIFVSLKGGGAPLASAAPWERRAESRGFNSTITLPDFFEGLIFMAIPFGLRVRRVAQNHFLSGAPPTPGRARAAPPARQKENDFRSEEHTSE